MAAIYRSAVHVNKHPVRSIAAPASTVNRRLHASYQASLPSTVARWSSTATAWPPSSPRFPGRTFTRLPNRFVSRRRHHRHLLIILPQLAAAGFYHKPTELSPDNTACFLCERALDGWEADDDPLSEHAKHSPDCGWAVIRDLARWPAHAYAEQLENGGVDGDDEFGGLEDPTGARLTAARRATFGNMWPHSGKRGWLCKPDKVCEGELEADIGHPMREC